MSKILFTNSYFYRFDPKQWKTKQPYPPLGTIYAAAFMRQNGHEVHLYDTNLVENVDALEHDLDEVQPDFLVIYDDGFNYLTKMCLTTMREAAFRMIQMGKAQGCQVIVSSSDSTDHYQTYLEKGADFIIHGEGEITLLELVTNIIHRTDTSAILGISYKTPKGIVKNAARPVLRQLDDLPNPAWDLIDAEPYRAIWLEKDDFFSLNIATTRGCPYKCNWCAKPIYGNRYNSRSPERVIEEIEYLIERFDVHYFWMCDDIFGLKPGWVQRFRDLKKEKGLDFQYKIQSRVDLMLKDDNLDALVDSGLHTAWVGAESGSQKILDAMDKQTTVEQIYEATQKLQSRGVHVAYFLQFGYLGETAEDIRKTIDMVLDNMPDEIGISVSYPLPGTKFYEKVKDDLKLKANWTDSDDLDMLFEGTYGKAFYKRLHRYVHNKYNIKKGWRSTQTLLRNPLEIDTSKTKDIIKLLVHAPRAFVNGRALAKHAGERI